MQLHLIYFRVLQLVRKNKNNPVNGAQDSSKRWEDQGKMVVEQEWGKGSILKQDKTKPI